ncbi:hypothetical protein ZOSMA_117G00390 [Zostera marina]|uniref:Stigma-specific Stig1 family protein n=1 Tax=Zostera marina TaxID=29655 RepID=A0A0K9Q1Q3_ZOSMR|nr:hypothetical protein ZOSMA_117G00390 [Zostera marina]
MSASGLILLALFILSMVVAPGSGDTNNIPSLLRQKTSSDGCTQNPLVCAGKLPPGSRSMCCQDVCTDVSSDVNNCGVCGFRCLIPTWGCCNGLCMELLINPIHCGSCFNTCPIGRLCFAGRCI